MKIKAWAILAIIGFTPIISLAQVNTPSGLPNSQQIINSLSPTVQNISNSIKNTSQVNQPSSQTISQIKQFFLWLDKEFNNLTGISISHFLSVIWGFLVWLVQVVIGLIVWVINLIKGIFS